MAGWTGLAGLLVWGWLIAGQLVSPLASWLVRGLVLLVGLLAAMVALWFWLLARRLHTAEQVRLAELPPAGDRAAGSTCPDRWPGC